MWAMHCKQCCINEVAKAELLDVCQYFVNNRRLMWNAIERGLTGKELSKSNTTCKYATLVKQGNNQVILLSELIWTAGIIPFPMTKSSSDMLKGLEHSTQNLHSKSIVAIQERKRCGETVAEKRFEWKREHQKSIWNKPNWAIHFQ